MATELTIEFCSLCRRVEQLRKHLLPQQFDATGSYTLAQYDHARAFAAFTHAEIEHYVEIRCLDVANKCCDAWLRSRVPSAVVFALYTICYENWAGVYESHQFQKLSYEANVESRLGSALRQYSQAISGNNGIKEEDLKKLLVPLSLRMSEFDSDWLSSMSSFGRVRGQIAHQTSMGLQQQPDPKDLRDTVWEQLIPGLRKLDRALSSLKPDGFSIVAA